MPFQIGQRPDHGFDEPLGLLSDCHRRIEHFLSVLAALGDAGAEDTLPAAGRQALEGALRYFAEAAPKHTADEEASLFPRLRSSSDPAVAAAVAGLDALEHDHDEAESQHTAVDQLGRRWLEAGRLSAAEAEQFRTRVAILQALYRRHIAVEDLDVFPVAGRALDRTELQAIGREMAARRQLRTDG
jgi:hemerythrin-like domain-containing protein